MESSRFDSLARLAGDSRSRRGVLRATFGAAAVALAAAAPGRLQEVAFGKKKKKRCKKAGKACSSDKQCCKKQKLICDVPHGAGNSDTECCGGQGAKCGGVDDEGNALGPFCCIGEAGEREFVCSQNDPETPNTPGTCIPAPEE